eukprot:2345552-Pyramimonas_sp.AAC.1
MVKTKQQKQHSLSSSSCTILRMGDFKFVESGEARLHAHDGTERVGSGRLCRASHQKFPNLSELSQPGY